MFKNFIALALPLTYLSSKLSTPVQNSNLTIPRSSELHLDLDKLKVETHQYTKMKIFGLTGGRELAQEIAHHLGTKLGRLQVGKNDGGETQLELMETVRGSHVFLIQSLCEPLHDNIMELIFTIRMMKRVSVGKVTLVIPFLAYNRQSETYSHRERGSLFAFDLALMIEDSGSDDIITMNLHHSETIGAFHKPIIELDATGFCVPYFVKQRPELKDFVIVGADERAMARVVAVKQMFKEKGIETALGCCIRGKKMEYVGDSVANKDVLLIEDIIDTGVTAAKLATKMKDMGSEDVYMFANHGIFSGKATEILDHSDLKEIVVTNTIPIAPHKVSRKISQVSVGRLLAAAILKLHFNKAETEVSLDTLYRIK